MYQLAKVFNMNRLYLSIITLTLLFGCNSLEEDSLWKENAVVSDVMVLPSDDKKQFLYKYYVKHKDAHYGSTWFSVLPDSVGFDPFADHFVFDNSISGFNIIGWDGSTVRADCILTDSQPSNLQPFRREVKSINKSPLSINYYYANSFGSVANCHFDDFKINKNNIEFFVNKNTSEKNEKYNLLALKSQIEIPLGDSIVRIIKLEKNMNFTRLDKSGKTLINQPRIAIESYKLKPSRGIDWKSLKSSGVFVEQVFKR